MCLVMICIFFCLLEGMGNIIVLKCCFKVLESLLMFLLWLLVVVMMEKLCVVCILLFNLGMGKVFFESIVIRVFWIFVGMCVNFFMWVIFFNFMVCIRGLGIRVFLEGLWVSNCV